MSSGTFSAMRHTHLNVVKTISSDQIQTKKSKRRQIGVEDTFLHPIDKPSGLGIHGHKLLNLHLYDKITSTKSLNLKFHQEKRRNLEMFGGKLIT